MSSAILTLDELAAYLKLSPATLQQQAEQGHLPGRKIGDDWRFLQAAIDDWLRAAPPPHAHEHHHDDNRPIFPQTNRLAPVAPPTQQHDRTQLAPENPWAARIGGYKDDAEFAEIAAELEAESDVDASSWME
jgi:excisionase family DNA binding protein